MRHAHLLTAAILAGLAQPWSAVADQPVLERVLLSTGGVGYFGYRAAVEDEGRVRLTVPLRQVDDILKSLTVLDDGGGTVWSVSLLGPTPLADVFRDAPFGEGDLGDVPTLLHSLRGAEVEVRGPAALRGRILAVAREEVVEGERATVRHRLSLLTQDGIRSAILETVDGVAFADPELERQVGLVLARLAENQREQQRELEIRLGDGASGRSVGLGYLAEVPLWKASYRLVAGGGEGLLQGWAILENASGHDWRDVAVTLIAGSPTALRQSLFESYFVPRPEVPVAPGARKEGLPEAPRAAMAAPLADGGLGTMAAPAERPAPTALDVASPRELTAQTLFPLPRPVTLPAGHTVMAPIVDRTLPVERVALYRAAEGGPHPRAALRLRNGTGSSLPAGLATLYERLDGGGLTYLGDALLPQLAHGAEELLAYGLDGNVEVTVRQDARGRIDRARIADGILELARIEQQRSEYAVVTRFAGAARSFVLEQEVPQGWQVAEPPGAVVEGGTLRVSRTLPAGADLDVAVVLERPVVERVALVDADTERLLLEFRGAMLSPELREALARLQTLSARLAEIDRQIGREAAAREERVAEQERLRANLEAVPPDSDLARRYLDRLAASEDELAANADRLEELRADRERAAAERLAFIRSLRV
ncbi:MAG TPA: hypothetical protein VFY87_09915 [Geminicoccaceae bacterium]|nr:hypothetical protein [Geminicoccaceae bacterium]